MTSEHHALIDTAVTMRASVSSAVGTSLALVWADIAIEHEDEAQRARMALSAAWGTDADWGTPGSAELRATLVTIGAAVSAIDGLYLIMRPLVSVPPSLSQAAKPPDRDTWVIETLRAAYRLKQFGNTLPQGISRSYALRNPSTHPVMRFGDPADHRVIPNTTAVRAKYVVEAATLTVDALLDMLTVMTDESRTDNPALAEWARNNLGNFESKLAERARLAALRDA